MKKILLCLLFPVILSAQETGPVVSEFFAVNEVKPVDQGLERFAKTKGGLEFTFTGPEILTDKQIRRIEDVLKNFSSWDPGVLNSFQVYVHEDRLDIAFIPQVYLVKGRDLASYLPSGLFFSWKNNLEYNFRIRQQNLLIKVTGVYTTKADLDERLVSAVDNPVLFLQKNDPEYLFKKVSELQSLTEELISRVKVVDRQYQEAKDTLLDGEKKLKDAYAEIQKNTKDLETARLAFMTYVNKDFFGGVHPIPPKELEKLKALRDSKPVWDEKDFLAEYRKNGGVLNDYEIGLVLAVFYGKL